MSHPGPRSVPFDLRPRRERTALAFDWVFPYAPWPAGRPLPTLRCWLDLPGAGRCEVALTVDTAADLTLVDGAFAAARGFDPTVGAARLEPVRGVGGGGTASIHRVALTIGPASDPHRLTLDLGFTHPDDQPLPINVLGRQGFLDRFDLAIRNYLLPPCLYLSPRRTPA